MTAEMEYLMYLYACGAHSVSACDAPFAIDWQKLCELAQKQSVECMLAYALKISPEASCPDNIKDGLYCSMLGTSIKHRLRYDAVLDVLSRLQDFGVRCVVIKGPDVARFYSRPECRISADTDILINKEDETKALDFFKSEGFSVSARDVNSHHSSCYNKKCGLIEVHTKLWDSTIEQSMFKKCGEKAIRHDDVCKADFLSREITVLGANDSMLFLTMHLIKHFIIGGLSLKAAFDTALYLKINRDKIDIDRFWRMIEGFGFSGLVSALLKSMTLWCGFLESDFDGLLLSDKEHAVLFAEAIEEYDSSSDIEASLENRAYNYFVSRRLSRDSGKLGYFAKTVWGNFLLRLRILFPRRINLEQKYPYLKNHPYLYLAAWTNRLFTRDKSAVLKSTRPPEIFPDERSMDEVTKERIRRFEELDLI